MTLQLITAAAAAAVDCCRRSHVDRSLMAALIYLLSTQPTPTKLVRRNDIDGLCSNHCREQLPATHAFDLFVSAEKRTKTAGKNRSKQNSQFTLLYIAIK